MELDAALELMAGGVGAGDFQGVGRNVGSVNLRVGQVFRECQGDATGARAYIDDARCGRQTSGLRGAKFQDSFDHMLSFRARDQDCGSDDEIHAPELLVACDVLRGDAFRALRQSFVVTGLLFLRQFAFGVGVEIRPVAVEGEHQEQLGVEAGRGDVVCGEACDGGLEGFAEWHVKIYFTTEAEADSSQSYASAKLSSVEGAAVWMQYVTA